MFIKWHRMSRWFLLNAGLKNSASVDLWPLARVGKAKEACFNLGDFRRHLEIKSDSCCFGSMNLCLTRQTALIPATWQCVPGLCGSRAETRRPSQSSLSRFGVNGSCLLADQIAAGSLPCDCAEARIYGFENT